MTYPPPGNYPPPGGYSASGAVGNLPQSAYTSWATRVGAYLIDAVPPLVVYGLAWGFATGTADKQCYSTGYGKACAVTYTTGGSALLLLAGLAVFVYAIWNFGYRQGTTGSSIGKSVLKFKVVGEATGQPIGFGLSFVRQIAHAIDGVILCIGYLFPLWDQKRQTLADKIMSTVCLPRT
ncbi:hypothetical protein AWC30_08155 [Mycolicibacillus trivialis]|uniref:RDD domain-containing protein n=1 Tax=Mycolicibacillus trivialis TaxID=1798 RepID=A0A1X2EMG9_9MYCO|nr:RDD family protein [Mycolicibacillus trivialis]ORX05792.1 hypothetical protein AWC30_08155 [Mycolicibacillus trivialis]